MQVGLGTYLVERSFFPEKERNDQERSHCSEKKTALNAFLKILERLVREPNGNCVKRTVKILNVFLFSRTHSKLGTQFKQECVSSSDFLCM